jgi:predicted RNA-binding protein with PIN domain
VFKNGKSFDGLMLASKDKILMEKEFKYRFPIEKKEWDIVASKPKPYDIVFISYNESNADANYEKLKLKRFDAKRVHGVKGIHNAHLAAAKSVTTEMFWVVDADAELVDDFNFEIEYIPHYDAGNRLEQTSMVHVWASQNPINDLVYGYGGVKLLPTKLTLEMDTESVDMTTSISKKFKAVNQISNISAFNVDEFSTWRSAFRECVKLSTKVINEQYDEETENRLFLWCVVGETRPFGKYAIDGAVAGKKYGEANINDFDSLRKINDYTWILEQFNKAYNE